MWYRKMLHYSSWLKVGKVQENIVVQMNSILNKTEMVAYQNSDRVGEVSLKVLENNRVQLSGEVIVDLKEN